MAKETIDTGTNKVDHELLRNWVAKKTLDTPLNTN